MSDGKNLRAKTLHGFAWMLPGTLGQNLMQFATLVVLARLLMPDDFGVVSGAMVVVGFMKIFAELGVGPAVVQRAELGDADIATANSLSVALGILLGAVVYGSAGLVAQFFAMPKLVSVLRTLAVALPVAGLSVVGQALLQREMRFKRMALHTLASYLVGNVLVAIPLALSGFGVWSLVFAHIAQEVAMSALVLIGVPKARGFGFGRHSAGALLDFGAGFSIARVANYFASQGDNIVVGRTLGAEALGFYGRAYQLMTMPAVLFGTVLDKVLFPAMASIQGDRSRLAAVYIRAVAFVAMISLPISAALLVMAEQVILVVLGDQWLEAVAPFQILAVVMVFRVSYKISDSLVRAMGAVYRRAWRQVVYAVLVFAGAWLGHFWGVKGVAIGVAVALAANFTLMLELSRALLGFSRFEILTIHLRHGVVALWVGLCVYFAKAAALHGSTSVFVVLLCGGVAAAVAICVAWIAFPRLFGAEGAYLLTMLRPALVKAGVLKDGYSS